MFLTVVCGSGLYKQSCIYIDQMSTSHTQRSKMDTSGSITQQDNMFFMFGSVSQDSKLHFSFAAGQRLKMWRICFPVTSSSVILMLTFIKGTRSYCESINIWWRCSLRVIVVTTQPAWESAPHQLFGCKWVQSPKHSEPSACVLCLCLQLKHICYSFLPLPFWAFYAL